MTISHFSLAGMMKEIASIAPSQCKIPQGPLASIADATINLGPIFPPAIWLDPSLLPSFLDRRPIIARPDSADGGYEVVGGFLSFSIVQEVLPPDRLFRACITTDTTEKLAQTALFELIGSFLASGLSGPSSHGHLYRQLRSLGKTLKTECPSLEIPNLISSPSNLRKVLGLSYNQTKLPRARYSTLSRIMEAG